LIFQNLNFVTHSKSDYHVKLKVWRQLSCPASSFTRFELRCCPRFCKFRAISTHSLLFCVSHKKTRGCW